MPKVMPESSLNSHRRAKMTAPRVFNSSKLKATAQTSGIFIPAESSACRQDAGAPVSVHVIEKERYFCNFPKGIKASPDFSQDFVSRTMNVFVSKLFAHRLGKFGFGRT